MNPGIWKAAEWHLEFEMANETLRSRISAIINLSTPVSATIGDVEFFGITSRTTGLTRAATIEYFKSLGCRFRRNGITANRILTFNDQSMAKLSGLPHLERLRLGRVSVTDAGLRHLANLKDLRNLTIADVPIVTSLIVNTKMNAL